MKQKTLITILFSLWSVAIYAQSEQADLEEKTAQVLALIENRDIKTLKQHTTQKMYCGVCFQKPRNKRNPYSVSKSRFYKKHFNTIFDDELTGRLKRNEKIIITEKSRHSDYIVLFTTYRNNEFDDGHEGAQFGFWFKEENGNLKLSGIETIP